MTKSSWDADEFERRVIEDVKRISPYDIETPQSNRQAHRAPAHDEICLVRAANVQMEKVDWLWSNHLARGKVTLLAGNTGLGKSQISYDFTARATKIGEWPDGDEAPIGNVVILSSEDAIKDTIVPRLAAAKRFSVIKPTISHHLECCLQC